MNYRGCGKRWELHLELLLSAWLAPHWSAKLRRRNSVKAAGSHRSGGIYCCNSGGYSGCPDTDAALRGGSTASDACSMQQYKFENRIFKLFISGNTASNACCMHGCKMVFVLFGNTPTDG